MSGCYLARLGQYRLFGLKRSWVPPPCDVPFTDEPTSTFPQPIDSGILYQFDGALTNPAWIQAPNVARESSKVTWSNTAFLTHGARWKIFAPGYEGEFQTSILPSGEFGVPEEIYGKRWWFRLDIGGGDGTVTIGGI